MVYPILDWTKADAYPKPDDLSPTGWAWEFLRRNGEYQDLWELFRGLPDLMTLPDGSKSNKNGKWKGRPWQGMRFLEDGAGFYADPPPEKGELIEDYYRRVHIMKSRDPACFDPDWRLRESDIMPFGEVMPFAQYLCERFKVEPFPPDPKGPFNRPDSFQGHFTDSLTEDSVSPWLLELRSPGLMPPPDLPEEPALLFRRECGDWHERTQQHGRKEERIAIVFDLSAGLDIQLERAKSILVRKQKDRKIKQGRRKRTHVNKYPRYIRILDALAVGAEVSEIAAGVFPGYANNTDRDYGPSKNIRAGIKTAEQLCNGGYFALAAG